MKKDNIFFYEDYYRVCIYDTKTDKVLYRDSVNGERVWNYYDKVRVTGDRFFVIMFPMTRTVAENDIDILVQKFHANLEGKMERIVLVPLDLDFNLRFDLVQILW